MRQDERTRLLQYMVIVPHPFQTTWLLAISVGMRWDSLSRRQVNVHIIKEVREEAGGEGAASVFLGY